MNHSDRIVDQIHADAVGPEFRKGSDAFDAGHGRHKNPHNFCTPQYEDWDSGWDFAYQDSILNYFHNG